MRCSICLHELPEDAGRCPYCSAEVEREEPENTGEEIVWTIIRTVSTEVEANLVAGQLRSFGIPAFVLSQIDSTRGLTVGALAVAKVFVPDRMVADAESILAAPPGDFDEDDAPGEPGDIPDTDVSPAPGDGSVGRLNG